MNVFNRNFLENSYFWKIFQFLIGAIFVIVLLWMAAKIFGLDDAFNQNNEDSRVEHSHEVLRLAFPLKPSDLEPTNITPEVKQVLANIYEPLVKLDENLMVKPALAISYGLIDDLKWRFYLRPRLKFHDGTILDVNDVIYSINRAREYAGSQLKDFFSTIEKIDIIDSYTFEISTHDPDPLLLQKLAQVLILPSEYQQFPERFIGTGPYKFSGFTKDRIKFDAYNNYWGKKPFFLKAEIIFEPDKSKRTALILNSKVDFLNFVPFEAVDILKKKKFDVFAQPSLEVQFLFFNQRSKVFEDSSLKQILISILDKNSLILNLGTFVKDANQFVSNGIFGFNTSIKKESFDNDELRKIIAAKKINKLTLKMDLPLGLDFLGEWVRKSLKEYDINLIVSYLEGDKFLESLAVGKADIYFLAFKSDLADSQDFFDVLIHSEGNFNFGSFRSEFVDKLIDKARYEMNITQRRNYLQEAMKIIVDEEIYGLPLFEYEQIFAKTNNLSLKSRIDGLIYLNNFSSPDENID